MIIYLDLVLFENIIMNYLILISTALICKSKISIYRIIISSIIGSIYSILNYFVLLNTFNNFCLKIFISFIMIKIAYKITNVKRFFNTLLMFYLISFTFGGISFMLLFFLKPENIVVKQNHFIGSYPIKVTIIGGIIGLFIIFIISILLEK